MSRWPPTSDLVGQLAVDPWPFILQTATLLAVPLAVGMFIAARYREFADRLRSVLTPLSVLALATLVIVGLQQNWGILLAAGAVIVPIAVVHNASAFALGAASARVLRLEPVNRRSLTFEVGIQNAGLGLLLLLNQFDGIGGAAAITAFWSVWHLIAGGTLVGFFRTVDAIRQGRPQEGE